MKDGKLHLMMVRLILLIQRLMISKKIGISNNDSEDHSNESNFSLTDKSDTRDNNLTLRLKGLGKRQFENFGFIAVVSYIIIFISNWEIINALEQVMFIVYHWLPSGHGLKRHVIYQFGYQ